MQWKTITSSFGNKAMDYGITVRKCLHWPLKKKNGTIYLESEKGEKRSFYYRKKGLFKE